MVTVTVCMVVVAGLAVVRMLGADAGSRVGV